MPGNFKYPDIVNRNGCVEVIIYINISIYLLTLNQVCGIKMVFSDFGIISRAYHKHECSSGHIHPFFGLNKL